MNKEVVGYFLAGYPDIDESIRVMRRCEEKGMQVLEIGYPSDHPCFDGKVIQAAHKAVVDRGIPELSYWESMRESINIPIWVMAYKSDFLDSGIYLEFAKRKLCDAIVIPDCDDTLRAALQMELSPYGIEVLGFASIETPEEQLRAIMKIHNMIYFQLYVGKTGSADAKDGDTSLALRIAREYTGVRLYAGFGISTAEKSKKLLQDGFDGVIIGTAFIEALNKSETDLLSLVSDIVEETKQ